MMLMLFESKADGSICKLAVKLIIPEVCVAGHFLYEHITDKGCPKLCSCNHICGCLLMHFKDNAWAKSRFFAHSLASDSRIVVRCKQNEGNIFKKR